MLPVFRHGGREINFLEIQLTTFRNLEIYECYHGLVDPVLNAPGWGVDVCLQVSAVTVCAMTVCCNRAL